MSLPLPQDPVTSCQARSRQELDELRTTQEERLQAVMEENEERMTRMTREVTRLGEENNERVTRLLEEQETQTALMVARHQKEERAARMKAELAFAPPASSGFDCPVS